MKNVNDEKTKSAENVQILLFLQLRCGQFFFAGFARERGLFNDESVV